MLIKTFGNSMLPFFRDGDILQIKKVSFSKIKVDDFVTLKRNGLLITHRVIFKPTKNNSQYLITKGDHNLYPDGKIYSKDILGTVVGVKRQGKIINPFALYLFQSTLYFQEIIKVKKALEKERIDFVFLKGLPLHLYFEKTHPKRLYFDTDILIQKKKFYKTSKILKKLGYRLADTSLSKIHSKLKGEHEQVSYIKLINGLKIEFDVHFQIISLMEQVGKLDSLYPTEFIEKLSDNYLKNKKIININNEDFPVLSINDLIVYLSFHLFHKNFRGYFRYQFLDILLRNYRADFKKIAREINEYQLKNFIYPVFLLLKKYYYSPVPKKFIKVITPPESTHRFINKNILSIDILESELRVKGGINRFRYLFFLSPIPLLEKSLVIFNIRVLYSLLWVLYKKLS